MVLEQMGGTMQETKDAIGDRDTTKQLVLFRDTETINIEEGPSSHEYQLIGSAFILGHPVNAVLGTSTLGVGTMGSYVVLRVTNPLNIFHEHLREDFFKATATTANWDTTNFRIECINNDIIQTNSIFLNSTNITKVKVTLDLSGLQVETLVDTTNYPGGRNINLT